MGVCNFSMFCCTLLLVHSSTAIMGKGELVALLNLSCWCLVMVEWLFLEVPWGCLRFVIVLFPDHTHLLFLKGKLYSFSCSQTRMTTNKRQDISHNILFNYQYQLEVPDKTVILRKHRLSEGSPVIQHT